MKRLGIITVLLLIVSLATFAAARFTTTSGDNAVSSMGMESLAQLQANMNKPEVVKAIQKLKAFLASRKGAKSTSEKTYVGSEYCIACHTGHSSWRDSAHATMHSTVRDGSTSMNPSSGIVFDGNANGIDDFQEGLNFNEISSVFDQFKPNAPILSYAEGEEYPYRVTIGEVTVKILIKQGGYYQQRLMTRLPVTDTPDGLSNGIYILPIRFGPDSQKYSLYHPEKWWDSNNAPTVVPNMTAAQVAATGRSWTKTCAGCHVTGYTLQEETSGEWVLNTPPQTLYYPDDPYYYDLNKDGFKDFLGVGCEACHGGGSLHILGQGDPDQIINPADLTNEQQVWLCGSCHTRAESVPTGAHDFGYNETENHGYRIGDNSWDYYQDNGGFWGDGITTAKGENQYPTYEHSAHFTNPYHFVACTDCHDVHSGERYLPKATVTEGTLVTATSFEDDTLCLSCHATHGPFAELTKEQIADYETNRTAIGTVVSAHTHHNYNPEGAVGMSRCTKCHMSRMAKRDYAYDETNHTMEAIGPQKTIDLTMPNSCSASCHNSWPLNFEKVAVVDNLSVWTEATDIFTTNHLLKYYGIGGTWWDTTPTEEK